MTHCYNTTDMSRVDIEVKHVKHVKTFHVCVINSVAPYPPNPNPTLPVLIDGQLKRIYCRFEWLCNSQHVLMGSVAVLTLVKSGPTTHADLVMSLSPFFRTCSLRGAAVNGMHIADNRGVHSHCLTLLKFPSSKVIWGFDEDLLRTQYPIMITKTQSGKCKKFLELYHFLSIKNYKRCFKN